MHEFIKLLITAIVSGAFAVIGSLIGAVAIVFIFFSSKKLQERLSGVTEENKFRLAALDKRLEIAQEAYRRSLKFTELANTPNSETLNENFTWWTENCLYLSDTVRNEFYICYRITCSYKMTREFAKESKSNTKVMLEDFDRLENLPQLIEESVYLSPINTHNKQIKL